MTDSSIEILRNLKHLVFPSYTTSERDLLAAEVGTVIFDSTQKKLCFKNDAAVNATSWELVTSVEET